MKKIPSEIYTIAGNKFVKLYVSHAQKIKRGVVEGGTGCDYYYICSKTPVKKKLLNYTAIWMAIDNCIPEGTEEFERIESYVPEDAK